MYDEPPLPGMQPHSYSQVDHHSLLAAGGPLGAMPSSALHIAEQMESGGAKIEETLGRLNCKYQTLFFVASWGVIFASIFAAMNSLLRFHVTNLVNSLFLLAFGLVMSVTDIPGSPRWAARYRQLIRKHLRMLTRLTGKSLWFLYLASVVATTLWPIGVARKGSLFLVFLSITTSCLVGTVAVIGIFISFRKSLRLERVRKALQATYKGNSPEVYRKYAITDPSHGMQFEEFNRMCGDSSQGRFQFDISDLGIIFNALDEHQKSAINEREFSEWMAGPMTYM